MRSGQDWTAPLQRLTRADGPGPVRAGTVVVIGGGLAGISAAVELAEAGLPVCLVESRPWLGGATCSFARRGLTVDNGQHVFLRSWTSYRGLLDKLGVADRVDMQDRLDLTVLAPGNHARIRRSGLPTPLHLTRSLARYQLLSPAERLMVLPALAGLWRTDPVGSGDEIRLGEWLARHGQGEHARRTFWDLVALPTLNTRPDRTNLGLARGVLAGLVLAGRDSADIGVPAVPLCDLHSAPAVALLNRLGVHLRLGTKALAIRANPAGGGYEVSVLGTALLCHEGQLPFDRAEPELMTAAGVVLAIPAWEAAALAPRELAGPAARWARLAPSPLVSIHVIYGRPVTGLPFAAAVDSPVRWIIDKSRAAGLDRGQYLAAAVPAADRYVDSPVASIRAEFIPALARLLPGAAGAAVEDFFVTKERRATFRQVPGSTALRPAQATSQPRLAVAGAWTSTGLPDTMEGAVRSGKLAATAVIDALASGDRPGRSAPQPEPAAAAWS